MQKTQLNIIFTHKDIFKNIFFCIIVQNYKRAVCDFNLICKEVIVDTSLWHFCFSRLNIQIPKYPISKITSWMNLLDIEFEIERKIDRCVEVTKYLSSNEHIYGTGNTKYFSGKCGENLFFETNEFNPEDLFHLKCFLVEKKTELLMKHWRNHLLHRVVTDGNYHNSNPQCIISFDDESLLFLCSFEYSDDETYLYHVDFFITEEDYRSMLKIFLKRNMSVYNDNLAPLLWS